MADREKVLAQCEWAIRQPSQTIIEAKKFYEEVLALLKEQDEGKYIPCKVRTKTGKWDGEKCSACGSTYLGSAPHKWRYCPDCGAKMEGR